LFELRQAVRKIDPCRMAVEKRGVADHHARADPRGLPQQRIYKRRRLIQDVLAVGHPLRGVRRLLLGVEHEAEQSQLDHARHGNQQQTLGE
jgi:hypothetical protein